MKKSIILGCALTLMACGGGKSEIKIDEQNHLNEAYNLSYEPATAVKEPTSYEAEMTFRARRHEIDLNGHVHNLCYLDFALECNSGEYTCAAI